MTDTKYKIIVSDKAKQMLGMHIRFIAQVNKEAAKKKKKELIEAMRSLEYMPHKFPFFEEPYIPSNKYHKMYVKKEVKATVSGIYITGVRGIRGSLEQPAKKNGFWQRMLRKARGEEK